MPFSISHPPQDMNLQIENWLQLSRGHGSTTLEAIPLNYTCNSVRMWNIFIMLKRIRSEVWQRGEEPDPFHSHASSPAPLTAPPLFDCCSSSSKRIGVTSSEQTNGATKNIIIQYISILLQSEHVKAINYKRYKLLFFIFSNNILDNH